MFNLNKIFAIIILYFITINTCVANSNQCISETTGLGGYQFKNNCKEKLKIYYTSGLLSKNGKWKAISINAGQTKVLISVNTPYYACPLKDKSGNKVIFDQENQICTVEEKDKIAEKKEVSSKSDKQITNDNLGEPWNMYLVALEQDIISSHFSKKSTWEEALIEIKLPSNYPYNDVIKCSNPGWFAIIQSIGHQYNSPNSTKHGAFMGCGFTNEVDGLKKVYNKCPFCSDASSLTAKWGYFNPAKIKEAGSYELDVNACDIRFKTNDIYPQYTDGKCDVNIVKQMYQ